MPKNVQATSIAPRVETRSIVEPDGDRPRARSNLARIGSLRCLRCEFRHLALCATFLGPEPPQFEADVCAVTLPAGQPLFGEGDPMAHVYKITAGTLRLFKLLPDGRRQITRFGQPGDFVGLPLRTLHAYGAEAVDQVEVCRFEARRLLALMLQFPALEHRLLEMQSEELVAAQDRMVLLGRKTPLEKIASFLLEVSARQTYRGRPASPVVLSMTRGDIADYLGLTVETVSRCFTRLKGDRSIGLPEPARVALLDRERLNALASGCGA